MNARHVTIAGLAAGLVAFEQLSPSCRPGPLMTDLRELLGTYPSREVACAMAHAECRLAGRLEVDLRRTALAHFEAHGFFNDECAR